jgi:putative hydrolase of the HAD superfamily
VIQCVVFDIDDTLYLERDYVRSGFEASGRFVAETLGVREFGETCWQLFLDGLRGNIFDRAGSLSGLSLSAEHVSRLVAVYRTHRPTISLLPDAAVAMDYVVSRSKCAVLTDGPVQSQSAKVRALGLDRFAAPVVLTGALGPNCGKPATVGFEMIQHQCEVSGASCVYVADNPIKDFLGPRQLGWRTVRVRRGEGLYAGLPSGPDVELEITTLLALESLLPTL